MNAVTIEITEGPEERYEGEWQHYAYTVELSYEGRKASFPWKQGLAHTSDPDAESVLENLLLDAQGYENATDFEDWASEYGYNTDSRKAEAIYNAVGEQTTKLRTLLGNTWAAIPGNEDPETIARRFARGLSLTTGL